jgi:N,N'-diacetyllegionaminate synthase
MPIRIADRSIGDGAPLFVIAEIGLNHGGSVDEALRLVEAAERAGASAVKLQTLHADGLVAAHCPAPAHVSATSLRKFFRQFELDEAAHARIAARARALGLAVLSTPFDEAAVELLERVGVDAYKIASGDLTHVGLIRRVARMRRPMVISTGMGTLDEARRALGWARDAGATDVAVLHCVSSYPAPADSENLAAIATLRSLGVPVGLSDHGTTAESVVAAVALGASVYERHLVTGGDSDAIDRAVSSSPEELAARIAAAERVRLALGDGVKRCLPAEGINKHASRRGLYAARTITANATISSADVMALRPSDGIPAEALDVVVGARAVRDIPAGQSLGWDALEVATHEGSTSDAL